MIIIKKLTTFLLLSLSLLLCSAYAEPTQLSSDTCLADGTCITWPDLENLTQIGYLGGSTGAKLYQDPETDIKYVLKQGASPGHIREEYLADLIYKTLGYATPDSHLYETSTGPVKLALYLENTRSLYEAFRSANEDEKLLLKSQLAQGFVLDALLANFDVIGLSMDNILVNPDGKAFRVDNGSSMRYRAMGALKNANYNPARQHWNPSPIALWSMRDPNINHNAALIFEDISILDIKEQIDFLITHKDTILTLVENNIPELAPHLNARLNSFQKLSEQIESIHSSNQPNLSLDELNTKLLQWTLNQSWGHPF